MSDETRAAEGRLSDGASHVHVFADAESVARAVAARFVELAGQSTASGGRFSVALSGGSTPRRVYELLAGEEFAARVDWPRVQIFFGDERCVPPDDAESNYRMARESLLSRVNVPAENVHRMRGEGDPPASARLYEEELRAFFGARGGDEDESYTVKTGASDLPRFDLIMLGMGDDGHTASLFPRSPALEVKDEWVAANWVEKFGAYRLTLTAPVINNAAHVLFVVTGAGKADRLREVVEGPRDPSRLPSQLIRPSRGALDWYVDQAAASKLNREQSATG
ncbi:MAG: 6-phosphogluconolactonase [Acidobacteriota bacterium]|nr:6-phosphogluconolactonase [Acidobacteriota bacterium]